MADQVPTPPPIADAAPVAAAALSYAKPSGAYRASGGASATGILTVFAGGLAMAALVGGALTALLLWRPVRLPFVVVVFAPGIAIGLGVAWLIRRAKVRNRAAAALIAGFCAAAAGAAVVGSLYAVAALKNRAETRAALVRMYYAGTGGTDSPAAAEVRIDAYVSDPFDLYDRTVLVPTVGQGGPAGYFAALPSDAKTYLLAAGGMTVLGAVLTIQQTSPRPFCEPCGTWYNAPYTAAVLPGGLADPVAVALEADDKDQVRQIRRAWRDAEIGHDFVSVRVYRCPSCNALLADVGIGAEPSIHAPPCRIDDAMREALRPPGMEPEPVAGVPAEAEANPAADL